MKRYSILIILFFISITLYSEAIYNGNISVVDNDFFFGFEVEEPGVYAGGSNTFPIGSYVEVKLPHSDVKASVKIVKRIPETGRFILVDQRAGEKLGLTSDDVVLVSVVVKKFIPNPAAELDGTDFNPEPEIKGYSSELLDELALAEDEITSDEITSDKIPSDKITTDEIPSDEIPSDEIPSDEIHSDEIHSDEIHSDEIPSDEIPSDEIPSDEIPSDEITSDEITSDEITSDEITSDEITSDEITSDEITSDEILEDLTLDDDVEDSLFTEFPELEDETEDIDNKIVKRIYFLEPADKKPPVGGIPDKDLIPVTKNDSSKEFKDGYYLQVGIYSDKEYLESDQDKLSKYNLPSIGVKRENGDGKDILLVGPLTNDELGVIMLYLKERGFKDFFRYIKKP